MSNAGFRPNIETRLNGSRSHLHLAREWGIPVEGEPVESDNGRNVAVWKGAFNKREEAPVIVVSAEAGYSIANLKTLWFCGLALKQIIEASPDDLAAFTDAASYQADSPRRAIDILKTLITGEIIYEPQAWW